MTRKWRQPWVSVSAKALSLILWLVVAASVAASATPVGAQPERISLDGVVVLVDRGEPSYLLYGAKDLASYLTNITGKPVAVSSSLNAALKSKSVIAIGKEMARALNADLAPASDLGDEGAVIRSFDRGGSKVVIIAGPNPHGTNAGLATFMPMIHGEDKAAYLDGPIDLRSKPSIASRGIHLNGWPLKYPYAFRSWKEEDWKRFIDIAWAQRINLFYLWPFMEIIPVPMSAEDEAYLQEVQTGCGLRAEPARHGSLDHAVGEPDRRWQLWHPRSAVSHLLGDGRMSERHEPGRSGAVRQYSEVVRSPVQGREQR